MEKIAALVLMAFTFAIVFALLAGFPAMWLWNWLMPAIFGVKTIGFWQAVGLCALGRILFGSGSTSSASK